MYIEIESGYGIAPIPIEETILTDIWKEFGRQPFRDYPGGEPGGIGTLPLPTGSGGGEE